MFTPEESALITKILSQITVSAADSGAATMITLVQSILAKVKQPAKQ